MYLSDLRFYNFRNLITEKIEFVSGTNFFIGNNAQGKTNIIEAIHVLSTGKSFRTSKASDLVKLNQTEFSLFAKVDTSLGKLNLGIEQSNGRKNYLVNENKTRSLVEYIGKLCCVCFNPDDLNIIKGAPELRRQFLDKHIVDLKPAALNDFLKYNKALKSKQLLLKSNYIREIELESWNVIISEAAEKINQYRREFIAKLEIESNLIHKQYSKYDGDLSLRINNKYCDWEELPDKRDILTFLNTNIKSEVYAKKCIYGPHRDDIIISLEGNNARDFASQGQARSLVLTLKFSVIKILERELDDKPIILLDDVDSELDRERSTALFDLIYSQEQQTIITGTESRFQSNVKNSENFKIFYVKSGVVSS